MADTYSARLRARKIARNAYQGTWDTPLNEDVIEIFDAAIDGEKTINIGSSTAYALSALVDGDLSDTHYYSLVFTGTPASAVTITVPASVTKKNTASRTRPGRSSH